MPVALLIRSPKELKICAMPLLVNMVTTGRKGVKAGSKFYKYSPGSKELVVADKFR
jgi:3-hydroxybutyryl-CoA dehydrogenase